MTGFYEKRVLVTGATSGLGLALADRFANAGARVILHGRTIESVTQAATRLKAAIPDADIATVHGDLTRRDATRAVARNVAALGPIDVIVNNAGAAFRTFQLTDDGVERSIAINHHAPLLLTHLMRDSLSPHAIAATVSSAAAAFVDINRQVPDVVGLTLEHEYDQLRAYGISKLLNIMGMQALARRLPSGPTLVLIDPGGVKTSLAEKAGDERFLALTRQHWDECVTADEAARRLIASLSGTLQQGALYRDGQIIAVPQSAMDSALSDRVYDATMAVIDARSQG